MSNMMTLWWQAAFLVTLPLAVGGTAWVILDALFRKPR